jgi:hypothetical protein
VKGGCCKLEEGERKIEQVDPKVGNLLRKILKGGIGGHGEHWSLLDRNARGIPC